MTASPEPLSLRRIYGQTLQVLWRDAALIAAIMLPLCGAAAFAGVWLADWLHGEIAIHRTGLVIPWLAETVPEAIADAAVVWVALRRLGGGRGPALGGAVGVLLTLAAVIAIDFLENADGLAELMIPSALANQAQPFFDLAVIIFGAIWAALWLPAVAVAVAERKTGPASLGRGLSLTLGHLRVLVVFTLTVGMTSRLVADLLRIGLTALGLGGNAIWILEIFVLPIEAFAGVSQAVVYWQLTRGSG